MFGVDVANWTLVLLRHLDFGGGGGGNSSPAALRGPFPRTTGELRDAVSGSESGRDPRLGTLDFYASSPDVLRYFCSRCYASVLYAVDDRENHVDVAIGLLDSPDGARAESFLLWGLVSAVGSREDVVGGWRDGLAEAVQKEAEAWRIERGYSKTWRRVTKEAADIAT